MAKKSQIDTGHLYEILLARNRMLKMTCMKHRCIRENTSRLVHNNKFSYNKICIYDGYHLSGHPPQCDHMDKEQRRRGL